MSLPFIDVSSTQERINYSMSFIHLPEASRLPIFSSSQYLESLCDYLYDDLRPRILHEPRLSVLCGVCRVLQALMVLDVPETELSSDEEELLDGPSALRNGNGSVVNQGLGRLHISHMLQSVLQDAQTRLFFKAQTIVQSEVRYYVPKPEDLDYPDKLASQFCLFLEDYQNLSSDRGPKARYRRTSRCERGERVIQIIFL